nr:RNA-directed DNA polymerase, eukaryota [Tanacetum cinerariifolium]
MRHGLPRGGAEQTQYDEFSELMQQVELTSTLDRWTWSLNPSGEFSVASVRKFIDDKLHPGGEFKTNWCRYVPIKVNIHAWKIMSNALAIKFNIPSRRIEIESLICVNCDVEVETTSHLFFTCITAQQVSRLINRWWNISDVSDVEVVSFDSWKTWMGSIQLNSKSKMLFEGVYQVMWWLLWWYRNMKIFEGHGPNKALLFDEVVSKSFFWCRNDDEPNASPVFCRGYPNLIIFAAKVSWRGDDDCLLCTVCSLLRPALQAAFHIFHFINPSTLPDPSTWTPSSLNSYHPPIL